MSAICVSYVHTSEGGIAGSAATSRGSRPDHDVPSSDVGHPRSGFRGALALESASLPEGSAVRPITLPQPLCSIGVVEGRGHMSVGTSDIAIAATLMLGDCARVIAALAGLSSPAAVASPI